MSEDKLIKLEQTALQVKEEDTEDELDLDDSIIENLDPMQIQYCRLITSGNYTKQDLVKHLQISKSKLTRWEKDPNVIEYVNYLKKEVIKDHRSTAKKQMSMLRDAMFADAMERMQHTPEDIVTDPLFLALPPSAQKTYMERHSAFTSFKDMTKLMMELNKMVDDMDDNRETENTNVIVEQIYMKAQQRFLSRHKKEELFNEHGLNKKNMFQVIDMDADGRAKQKVEPKDEEIEQLMETDLTKITITKTKKEKKND